MNKAFLGQMITTMIPILVPIITMLVKTKVLPFLQGGHKWAIPIIAVALGAGLDYANTLLTGGGLGVFGGIALGALGVVLREVKDQVQRNP